MGCSRYGFGDPGAPHFMTCTILEWTPAAAWATEGRLNCFFYRKVSHDDQ